MWRGERWGFVGCTVWYTFRRKEVKGSDMVQNNQVWLWNCVGRNCGCGASGSGGGPQSSPMHSFVFTYFQQEGLGTSGERIEIPPSHALQISVCAMRVFPDGGQIIERKRFCGAEQNWHHNPHDKGWRSLVECGGCRYLLDDTRTCPEPGTLRARLQSWRKAQGVWFWGTIALKGSNTLGDSCRFAVGP